MMRTTKGLSIGQSQGPKRLLGLCALLAIAVLLNNVLTQSAIAQDSELVVEPLDSSTVLDIDSDIDRDVQVEAIGGTPSLNDNGYRTRQKGESEFDNYVGNNNYRLEPYYESDSGYEDTVFGEFLYNEASTSTKLEMLRLLSKDTPSMLVFMQAISMGLDIESLLQASIRYQPEKSRDLAASAVTILPLLDGDSGQIYGRYELDDLDREDDSEPYSVAEVMQRYFEDRDVLAPYPDWYHGQFHFEASAKELLELQEEQPNLRWYRSNMSSRTEGRPVFISLYEHDQSVVIDSHERIKMAVDQDSQARLPVVFIFNRIKELAVDQLDGYPQTIKGIQQAYSEQGLMLTPTPEWQIGEYHFFADIEELYDIFDLPEEEDFEPEAWQKLIGEAEDYSVNDTSFLMVVVGGGDDDTANIMQSHNGQQLAAWDDPRTESSFPFVAAEGGEPITFKNLIGKGLIINRPDLIAALAALGVESLPVAFYYIDSARVIPYVKGPRALVQLAIGITSPLVPYGGSGGLVPPPVVPPVECASPPCTE